MAFHSELFDMVGSVDIEHIAAEIEDLGTRDLREVGSYLVRLIELLLKIDACPVSRDRLHWLSEAAHFHDSAADAFTPGVRQSLAMDRTWRRGRRNAMLVLEEMAVTYRPPATCPFELDELLAETLDLRAALGTLEDLRTARDMPRP